MVQFADCRLICRPHVRASWVRVAVRLDRTRARESSLQEALAFKPVMAPEPPKVVHLDQFESIPGPGSLTWRPVRVTLGIRAFGCNAHTAGKAGQGVVEPHTEDP